MKFNAVVLAIAFLSLSFTSAAQAATIHTDGTAATGISGLQVPSYGVYNVDFVFDSFDDLFVATNTPNPTPTFWSDATGASAAMTAIVSELQSVGGLTQFKDDTTNITTPDASTGYQPTSSFVVVETAAYSSSNSNWLTVSGTAFGGDVEFMQAIFTQVPEPASLLLMGMGMCSMLFRRRGL